MFVRSALWLLALGALASILGAQTITLGNGAAIPAGSSASGALLVPVASFTLERSGANSLFTGLTLVNNGSAGAADYVRYQLWREADANSTLTAGDTLLASANSPSLVFSGFSNQIPVVAATYYVSVDIAAGATDGRTFVLSIVAANITLSQGTKVGGPINANTHTISSPTQLVITTQPSGASGGTAFSTQPVVEVRNASNVVVTSFTGNVSVAKTAGPSGTLSGTTVIAAVAGVATFTNLSIDLAGTGYVLTFSSGSLTPAVSNAFNVTIGAANKLGMFTQPSGASGGSVFGTQPVVQVLDAGNNVVNSSAVINAAITTGTGTTGAVLSGTVSLAATAGVASFTDLSINLAGTGYRLTFTSGSLTSVDSALFNVVVGSAVSLAITTQPSGALGGSAFTTQPVIELRDAGGNLVTAGSANVAAAITTGTGTTGAALSGTASVASASGVATFTNLSINLAGTGYRLTFTSGSLTSVDSSLFNVTVGAAAQLAITTQPSGATGGTVFGTQPVIEIRDAGGNLVNSSAVIGAAITTGTGTTGAVLSGTVSLAATAGVASFTNLSINLAGTGYRLTFTSGSLTSVDSALFNVVVGSAVSLAITTQPSGALGGSAFTTQPVVELRDAGGNLVTTGSANVNAAISTGTGTTGATLSGTTSVASASGVATFTNLSINLAGTGYRITFTSGSLTSVDSSLFNVIVGAAAQLAITTQPSGAAGGIALGTQPIVEIRDAGGNVVTSSSAVVSAAITTGTGATGAALLGTTGVAASSGVVTFTNLAIDLASTGYTLDFTSGSLTLVTSAAFDITVGSAASLLITTQPAGATGGAAFATQPVVTVRDAGGNLVTSATNNISASITTGTGATGAVLSGTLSVAASGGVATFSGLSIDLVGTGYTLDFDDGTLPVATSSAFDVTLGSGSTLRIVVAPGSATQGLAFTTQPQIEIVDAGGNRITSDNSTMITATITSGTGTTGAVLSGTNPVQMASGLAVFTNLAIDMPGTNYRLDFDGGSLATLTSALFDVAGVPTLLGIGTQPGGATAGSAFTTQPVVEVRDAAGAVVSSDNSTQVTAAITTGTGTTGAVLSGTLTIVVVNGIANFSGLAIDLAGTGYTLTFTSTPALTPVISAAFSNASTATQLSIDTQPDGAGPATVFLQQPVVSIRDVGGAVVTADNTTQVTATITSGTGAPAAVLSGTTTVTAINGVATFTNLSVNLTATGYTLTFTSTPALTPAVSAPFNVATAGGGGKKKKKSDEGCTTGEEQSWLLLAASLALAFAATRRKGWRLSK